MGLSESSPARDHFDQKWVEERREQMQRALLEGRERLQAIMDETMAAVHLKNVRGRYLMVNRWAEIMFRVVREFIVGRTDHELFPKEMADVFYANDLRTHEAGAPLQFEEFFLRGGKRRTYAAIKFPLYDSSGKLYAICGISTDVTERKRAERLLWESEERFRSLVQNASDVFMILGDDGTMQYQSPSIKRVLGYQFGELLGENAFDYIHPDDAERVRAEFSRIMEDPMSLPITPVEYRFRHADGSWRHLESVGSNQMDKRASGASSLTHATSPSASGLRRGSKRAKSATGRWSSMAWRASFCSTPGPGASWSRTARSGDCSGTPPRSFRG